MSDQKKPFGADASRPPNREDLLDQITGQYQADHVAGKEPLVREYMQRYPDLAKEIAEFALSYHAIGAHLPEADFAEAPPLSPLAQQALQRARAASASPQLSSLIKAGTAAGMAPPALAGKVGITPDVLAKLESRMIRPESISRTLVQRLADALTVSADAVAAFLAGSASGAPAFFYANAAPTQQPQEDFLHAIDASGLPADAKREWHEIVTTEAAGE